MRLTSRENDLEGKGGKSEAWGGGPRERFQKVYFLESRPGSNRFILRSISKKLLFSGRYSIEA